MRTVNQKYWRRDVDRVTRDQRGMRGGFCISRWKQERWLWTVILTLGFLSACEETPVQPSPTEGVTVYQHSNFRGDHRNFVNDFNNFADLVGPCGAIDSQSTTWNNCVSSIKIAEGWEATIFERDDYGGESLKVTSEVAHLTRVGGPCGDDWNDCISSIRVQQKPSE